MKESLKFVDGYYVYALNFSSKYHWTVRGRCAFKHLTQMFCRGRAEWLR